MEYPNSETNTDIFPMAIACTGCATRYKIDKPRSFTCPHCGNHIQILGDGKVEIIPKATMDREIEAIQELEEAPHTRPSAPLSPSSQKSFATPKSASPAEGKIPPSDERKIPRPDSAEGEGNRKVK